MRKHSPALCLTFLATASPVSAAEPCPPRAAAPLGWAIDGIMSGDRFADVYLDINEHGRPMACRIGRNNLLGDEGFWVCRAFLQQWSMKRPASAENGRPVTVQRKWIQYGVKHANAEKALRNEYFRDHSSERPECHPKDASTGQIVWQPGPILPASGN